MAKEFDPYDLVGKRINNLTVIEYCGWVYEKSIVKGELRNQKKHFYLVECDCGRRNIVRRGHLTSGKKTMSCGCSRCKVNDPVYSRAIEFQ